MSCPGGASGVPIIFFYGEVHLIVLSGTRNLLPSILGKEFWFTAAMKDEEKKKYSRK